jgi:hypothetical protein
MAYSYLLFERGWFELIGKLAAWEVQESDFPSNGTLFDKLKFLLMYGVLAPSGPNTQPWKLSIKGNEVSLIADFARSLPNVDPNDRTLYISNGCLLANILLGAEHFGLEYSVKCLPDGQSGDRTAVVRFSEVSSSVTKPRFSDLFKEITKRHTNRKRYEDRAIEDEKLKELKSCINREGFRLDIITDKEVKNKMANLLGSAHKIQLGNKAFRKELASWVRPNTSDAKDGLPGYSFGYSDFESFFGSFIFGTFDMSGSRARIETAFMKASPALAVLSTESDDKLTWIKTGILFEILFLTATKLNVMFDLFSQPIGIPELRQEMSQILNAKYPQILIRMGYAEPAKHTPRRTIEEVLIS